MTNETSKILTIPSERAGDGSMVIDVAKVVNNRRQLRNGLVLPATRDVKLDSVVDHAAEPVKSVDDIAKISQYLIGNKRYRDNMLFIVGINFGLRASDLLKLRFCHLIDENLMFKTTFPIVEQKTKNTRAITKNRYVTVNDAVIDAVTLYLEHSVARLDDFMFKSQSNNGKSKDAAMSRQAVDYMLKSLAKELCLPYRLATHSLRKTFGYHQMAMSNNDPRKLMLLQKIFGHSSPAMTLNYIGITGEEIEDAYLKLNLGSFNSYLVKTQVLERLA